MLRVGFEPTIPVFERAKTVHVLDRAATVIGKCLYYNFKVLYAVRSTVRNHCLYLFYKVAFKIYN
jgi:hypothetical protein